MELNDEAMNDSSAISEEKQNLIIQEILASTLSEVSGQKSAKCRTETSNAQNSSSEKLGLRSERKQEMMKGLSRKQKLSKAIHCAMISVSPNSIVSNEANACHEGLMPEMAASKQRDLHIQAANVKEDFTLDVERKHTQMKSLSSTTNELREIAQRSVMTHTRANDHLTENVCWQMYSQFEIAQKAIIARVQHALSVELTGICDTHCNNIDTMKKQLNSIRECEYTQNFADDEHAHRSRMDAMHNESSHQLNTLRVQLNGDIEAKVRRFHQIHQQYEQTNKARSVDFARMLSSDTSMSKQISLSEKRIASMRVNVVCLREKLISERKHHQHFARELRAQSRDVLTCSTKMRSALTSQRTVRRRALSILIRRTRNMMLHFGNLLTLAERLLRLSEQARKKPTSNECSLHDSSITQHNMMMKAKEDEEKTLSVDDIQSGSISEDSLGVFDDILTNALFKNQVLRTELEAEVTENTRLRACVKAWQRGVSIKSSEMEGPRNNLLVINGRHNIRREHYQSFD